jgi:hypothetical protein
LGRKEKKNFKVALSDMGFNGMKSHRTASNDCWSMDFGISDVEIQWLLLWFSSAPSKQDILYFKIKNLATICAFWCCILYVQSAKYFSVLKCIISQFT